MTSPRNILHTRVCRFADGISSRFEELSCLASMLRLDPADIAALPASKPALWLAERLTPSRTITRITGLLFFRRLDGLPFCRFGSEQRANMIASQKHGVVECPFRDVGFAFSRVEDSFYLG